MNGDIFGDAVNFDRRAERAARGRQGVRHCHRIAPLIPQAGDAPTLTVTVETSQAITDIRCILTAPASSVIPLTPGATEWDHLNWAYRQTWHGALPAYPAGTLVRYTLQAHIAEGATLPVEGGMTYSYLVGAGPAPDWAETAVLYQIFVDRFHPGAGRDWRPVDDLRAVHGGTLPGITEKLDYLADLGVNCLWLTPIFPDEHAHGYHATDYFSLNPRLGTLDDARDLLAAAHARGIRVLLDFAANHVGSAHPAFQRARADRESAEYRWFYWRDWPDDYGTYYGIRDLPKLNTDDPGARAYLLRSVRFWLDEMGFDGLRLDHANGPTHDFWTALRAHVETFKPDAWLFGEVMDTPDLQRSYAGRLHGMLDFMVAQALRDTFAFGTSSLQDFDAFLHLHEAYFPPDFSRPSFLDNHDMDRFLWAAGNDLRRLKLAAVCQFTLSGPPIIYAGTELGLSQRLGKEDAGSAGADEARRRMPWADYDADLLAFYRELIHFRRAHPVLARGARRTLHADNDVYAYLRDDETEAILIALNRSEAPQTLTLTGDFARTLTLAPMSYEIIPASP